MAETIKKIRQIQAPDGTFYELDAKYFDGKTFEEVFKQADAMVYRGVISFTTSTGKALYTPAGEKGDVYKVSVASGLSGCTVNGILVDNGDMFICNTDGTPAATPADPQSGKWDVIQSNIDASGLATATHVHIYTPEGDVSQPEFTGTQVTSLSGKADIVSTVSDKGHSHDIEYTETSSSVNEQSVTVATSDHAHAYTPEGTVKVTLTDNGHTHEVTAEGTVSVSRSKGVAAESVEDGGHTHTIDLKNVTVNVTDEKHKHTATVTNHGTAAAQAFTGEESETSATEASALQAAAQSHTHSVSVTGTAEAQKFTGTESETKVDDVNVVSVSTDKHTHTYKPSGSVTSNFTGSEGTTNGTASTGQVNVAADGHTHGGALKARIEDEILIFSLDGEVAASTAKTAVATAAHTHTYTPSGSISAVFAGEEATIGATDTTNVASVATGSHKHKFTAVGTNAASNVSASGSASVTTTAALSVAANSHKHKFTPVGTNAASAVSGITVTVSEAATGINANFSIDSAATSVAGAHTHGINITQQPEFTAEFTGAPVTTVSANTGLSAAGEFTGKSGYTEAPSNNGVAVAALSHSHTYEKATTIVSAATGITVASVDNGHVHNVTAAGTVSKPTFTGRQKQTSGPETVN